MAEHKLEEKEILDRTRFQSLLREWNQALERNEDMQVTVNGKTYTVPADAADRGRLEVEFEKDKDEYEFEITLKWK